MKTLLCFSLMLSFCMNAMSQDSTKINKEKILKELAESGCKCVDSISVYDKAKPDLSKEINKCINEETTAYMLLSQLMGLDTLIKNAGTESDGNKKIDITVNTNEDSKEYKEAYYEIERYMMDNCPSLKTKIASNDKLGEKSFSSNAEAMDYYSKGLDEEEKENHQKAIEYYKKAVKIDPQFAFAWDNMGIAYRKMGNYEEALKAYKRSLEIDPKGLMPLQNIAIVYIYKKEYTNAIGAYEKLAELDKNNPEVFYGMGQVYAAYLNDLEKGLDNMCKAYNLYIEQKSPYRTDAEKMVQAIFTEMKKQGKEARFYEILKAHNISPN